MALEYNGQRVGAMQYNGVTIGEAMIDGEVVYRSVIRVTPVAPTFHDGEPWITLPTVEGVTYSVSGTPGYDASVTVTATAQPGYELVGTASWAHTYGPPPRYTITVIGDNITPARYEWVPVVSHTVTRLGVSLIAGSVNWVNRLDTSTYQVRIVINGSVIATNTVHTQEVQSVSVGSDRIVNPGDVVVLQALSHAADLLTRRRVQSPTLTFT